MAQGDPDTDNATSLSGTPRLTLRKGEKLRHRSLVDSLFAKGESIYEFPFRLTFRALSEQDLRESFRDVVPSPISSLQMLITVPKKKRRKAVDRVLMRRRIREAYRLNRLPLKEIVDNNPAVASLDMAFVYIHDKNTPYATIEKKMKVILKKLSDRFSPTNSA
ncbi:MAG: ribonuclease P protein component [Muribaculaceae bacterium]|nr:ribonuclease P protein component [Muribaculaceae bacterium]MDE6753021.1 ribonuclease P protein component [Muribaculaceae bacterium]